MLVVEAGTGRRQDLRLPGAGAAQRRARAGRTATKTLQDQLFGRDLPRLAEALGLPVRTALLKGRGSYLCLHRLELARDSAQLPDRFAAARPGTHRAMGAATHAPATWPNCPGWTSARR